MKTGNPITFGHGRFLIERELGRGAMGIVYQALDQEREMLVALKTLLHMDTAGLYYLKREFRALHDIVHPNLCSLMELIKDEKSWFLTMELVHGVDFLTYVHHIGSGLPADVIRVQDRESGIEADLSNETGNRSLGKERLRATLRGLCSGLGALHAAGKVHRDIKPSNVLITEQARVVLLDFGLVTDQKNRSPEDLKPFVGSAAYMAPEQAETRFVGPESDWYAVGVMLYEVLTGSLPFNGAPIKVMFSKQTTDPVRPSEIAPGVPEEFELLCMALLNRDPAARPNESQILDTIDSERSGAAHFVPGDITESLLGEIFVGRQAELALLRDEFARTSGGSLGTVVVEGVSGVGKSALVENLISDILSDDPTTLFLKGRCYERESAPFKAFDAIIESLAHCLLSEPADAASELMPKNSELLLRLFPDLRRSELFNNTHFAEIQIADPHEMQSRAFDALKELLLRLSNRRRLIIAIDDLQWADADSLLLLKHLAGGADSLPLMLILLSRFAADSESSVLDWNDLIGTDHARIRLGPLDGTDSEKLTRQLIERENVTLAMDVSSLSIEAAGHPLFIAELVHHVALGGEAWRNLRIDEVISRRVETLPPAENQLLKTICVAGTPLESGHLKTLTQMESRQFFDSIAMLRAKKFITSRGPRAEHLIEPYHDRVRESVVAHCLSTSEANEIQLSIGRFFLRVYSESALEKNIFFVVQHLFSGIELIKDEEEQLHLAELFLLAGKKAGDSAAFTSSLVYFKRAIEIYRQKHWQHHYQTMFSLYCSAADAAYITGDFELARKLVKTARLQAKTDLDQAIIYETYILSLVADGKHLKAIDVAVRMLRRLGVRLPRRPGKIYVLFQSIVTKILLHGKTKDELLSLPQTTRHSIMAAGRLINTIADTAYLNEPNLSMAISFKLLQLTLRYGINFNSAIAFGAWGAINCVVFKNYPEGYKYGKISLEIMNRFERNEKEAMGIFIWTNFVQHWTDHIRDTFPYMLKSHEMADRNGNLPYVGYAGTLYCYNLFFAGVSLEASAQSFEHYGRIIEHKKQDQSYVMNRIYYQAVLNLKGQSGNTTKLEGVAYNETELSDGSSMGSPEGAKEGVQPIILYSFHCCKLILQLFFNEYENAYHSALKAESNTEVAAGSYRAALMPFYDSLACLKYYPDAAPPLKRKLLRRVRKNQRGYRKVAKSSPANHAHKYQLVEAEWARLKGKRSMATMLYDKAIRAATQQKFTQDAAFSAECAADFSRENGDRENMRSYARQALSHYEKWGAWSKAEQVKQKFDLE